MNIISALDEYHKCLGGYYELCEGYHYCICGEGDFSGLGEYQECIGLYNDLSGLISPVHWGVSQQ